MAVAHIAALRPLLQKRDDGVERGARLVRECSRAIGAKKVRAGSEQRFMLRDDLLERHHRLVLRKAAVGTRMKLRNFLSEWGHGA